ncbi:transferase family-domain-containing protein [Pyrenochaeta sp. MPI-SDFR-AT-0127]|nr:transferase family-domain-containing protein [Pyrenochaeta sp. MPI-SDFR-AT-0127]
MVLEMDLDLMGTQPALYKLYTQLAFIFAMPDPALRPFITETITHGLEHLSRNFPWVAGQVENVNLNPIGPPVYKIRSFESIPRLTVKDYSNTTSVPTLEEFTAAKFPMSMLGEETWAPCPTLAPSALDPLNPSEEANEPAPVMLIQINFIRGGVLLCVNMQHNTCDMMGQAAVIAWFSKACRGHDFTKEEIEIGNKNRVNTVPLIVQEGWSPGPELKYQMLPPQPASGFPDPNLVAPSRCSWSYFDFSATSLETLKDVATKSVPHEFGNYVSTDDALSAFIFQSVLRARLPRLSSDSTVTFARAVDARRYLNVHHDYPGILQNMTYTSYLLSTLLTVPLGHIAATMRGAINPTTSDIAQRTRSLVTLLSQSPENASRVNFTATLKLDADIMLSSWTKVAAYEWDFAFGLGPPVAVRRPCFIPVESLMYIMPKEPNRHLAVAMCLRDEDLDFLKQDTEWNKLATYLN